MIYFILGFILATAIFVIYILWHRREQKKIAYQLSMTNSHFSSSFIKTEAFFFDKELTSSINSLIEQFLRQKKDYEDTKLNFKNMATSISHDFRTPLTSISGYVQVLLEDDNISTENKIKYLEIIKSRAISLSSLIEDFYTTSSIDSLDYPYIPAKISISEILREQIANYYVELEKRYNIINIDILEEPCFIKSDRISLQRIFSNLIKNSLSYGVNEINISLKDPDKSYKVIFSNSLYENADKTIADKIFERNYSVDWANSSKSTGLGLSIAKSLTEKSDGTITASVENDMLIFEITFPKYPQ